MIDRNRIGAALREQIRILSANNREDQTRVSDAETRSAAGRIKGQQVVAISQIDLEVVDIGAAIDYKVNTVTRSPDDSIIAIIAVDSVQASATIENVVSCGAAQFVVSGSAVQSV